MCTRVLMYTTWYYNGMYVCMYVPVCMYEYVLTRVVHVYSSMDVCTCTYYVCTRVWMYVCYGWMDVCMAYNIAIYVHVCMYQYVHVYTCIGMSCMYAIAIWAILTGILYVVWTHGPYCMCVCTRVLVRTFEYTCTGMYTVYCNTCTGIVCTIWPYIDCTMYVYHVGCMSCWM